MGYIVKDGKRYTLGPTRRPSGLAELGPRARLKKTYTIRCGKGSRTDFSVCGREGIAAMENNIAVVREHFGVNLTDALRIAIHLTAKAIGKNRAFPEIG